jgi:hypothetical protein
MMNSVGRMQKMSGMRIFTGTFCAFSSARPTWSERPMDESDVIAHVS